METALIYLSYTINVIVALAWIGNTIRSAIRKRTASGFFGSTSLTVFFPLRYDNRILGNVAAEDFDSALRLASFLSRLGIEAKFREIRPDSTPEIGANSIVLCGPKSSSLVKAFMETDPVYGMVENSSSGKWGIIDKSTNEIFNSPMDSEPEEQRDLAYVGRLENNLEEKFILVAGLHAIGTYGAVSFLCNLKNIRNLKRSIKHTCFSIVIEVIFNGRPPQIVRERVLLRAKQHK